MKPKLVHLALASLIAPMSLFAQEAAAPGRLQLAPAATQTPAEEVEVTLIPEQIKPAPKVTAPEPKAEPKSKTEESSEDLLMRIHFREARIKALRDEKVQSEYARAMAAKTDQGKRDAMKSYYKLLYARILKLDPSVAKLADLRQHAALRRLEQTRIDPTEPLDPRDRLEQFARSRE